MTTELISAPDNAALRDLRSQAMLAPVEVIRAGLAEYSDRRNAFRAWLQSQLVPGVHYGFPPGINVNEIDPARWKVKPSLYKAGAELIVDLMGLRCEFACDTAAWAQMGSPVGTFVVACYLVSKATGERVGEGRGVRKVGDKKMDANASLKMAEKAAKVDAVINTYGVSDLFTQDIEDAPPGPQQHYSPQQDPIALQVPPRDERITGQMLTRLEDAWRQWRLAEKREASADQFNSWAAEVTGIDHTKIRRVGSWDAKTYGMAVQLLNDERRVM